MTFSIVYVRLYVFCLPVERESVSVFTCLESFIAGSMQDFESSAEQVTKHE